MNSYLSLPNVIPDNVSLILEISCSAVKILFLNLAIKSSLNTISADSLAERTFCSYLINSVFSNLFNSAINLSISVKPIV